MADGSASPSPRLCATSTSRSSSVLPTAETQYARSHEGPCGCVCSRSVGGLYIYDVEVAGIALCLFTCYMLHVVSLVDRG
jgi:hypothetical protein